MKNRLAQWVVFAFGALSLQAQTHRFTLLGPLDAPSYHDETIAHAITPDGKMIFGTGRLRYANGLPTFDLPIQWSSSNRWQSANWGLLGGTNTNDNYEIWASSVDGSVVVGWHANSTSGTTEAIYWTPANNFQFVPLPVSQTSAATQGVSGDGRYLVGHGVKVYSNNYAAATAFWSDRNQASASFLPPYPQNPGTPNSDAWAVSDDGRRVVGKVQVANTNSPTDYRAALWIDGANPVLLTSTDPNIIPIDAFDMTPDGSVVVGRAYKSSANIDVAYRWTAQTGAVALGMPHEGGYYTMHTATAYRISRNGHVIVGYGNNSAGTDEAIYWDDRELNPVDGGPGTHRVAAVAGIPTPLQLYAYAVDYFGNTIVGYGFDNTALEGYAFVIDVNLPPPTLAAPGTHYFFDPATHKLTIRYQTVPGLKYRVLGGSNVAALGALSAFSSGLGEEREYSVTNPGSRYFLRVEVSAN